MNYFDFVYSLTHYYFDDGDEVFLLLVNNYEVNKFRSYAVHCKEVFALADIQMDTNPLSLSCKLIT